MNGHPCSPTTGATVPPLRLTGELTTSQKLAEKLLLGWVMLADTCPQCATVPLMRDKQRQVFCVACETFLLKEEDSKESNNKTSSVDGRQQRQVPGNDTAISDAHVTGKVHYRLGGVVPLSATMEENERLVAAAAASFSPPFAPHDSKRGPAASTPRGRERGRSGGTGGDSRKTESSSDESERDTSHADSKISSELQSWRESVRRRCWGTSPSSCIPLQSSSLSSSGLKKSQGEVRGEKAAAIRGRGGGASPRSLRSAGRARSDTRKDRRDEEEPPAVSDIFNGLRESTLRKIERYRAWLDLPGDNYEGAVVERDRQVFSALHAALQVLDDLRRVE